MKDAKLIPFFLIMFQVSLFTVNRLSGENKECIRLGNNREIFVDLYLIDKLRCFKDCSDAFFMTSRGGIVMTGQ
jgi:hypothetical protein